MYLRYSVTNLQLCLRIRIFGAGMPAIYNIAHLASMPMQLFCPMTNSNVLKGTPQATEMLDPTVPGPSTERGLLSQSSLGQSSLGPPNFEKEAQESRSNSSRNSLVSDCSSLELQNCQ